MSVSSVTTTSATPSSDMISSRSETMSQADFLAMLVEQLKAQDPLDPMDSQDFASQLATFTSLQELQGIGTTLDQSLDASLLLTQTFSNTMATTLIGKMVQAEANGVTMGASGAATLSYDLAETATDITIEIQDADGNVVRTLTVPSQKEGQHQVAWDGLNSDGEHVAAGSYTFSVTALDASGNSVEATTYIEGRVTG
ncbi:MAG: FlgD immunoglobulin-like domain containing protein, partial [bacterium]|nr:FlgD immunoglobulin-like domain containing protein [bacterium]